MIYKTHKWIWEISSSLGGSRPHYLAVDMIVNVSQTRLDFIQCLTVLALGASHRSQLLQNLAVIALHIVDAGHDLVLVLAPMFAEDVFHGIDIPKFLSYCAKGGWLFYAVSRVGFGMRCHK